MTADLKPYPSYKPSGVAWLGDVPTHWEVRRLKWVASLNPSKTEARTFLTADTPVTFLPMERVGTDGEIDEEMVSASGVWNGFTYFRRDDVLVAKITPCFENGKGACLDALSTEIGFGSTEFHVLRAGSSIFPQFLYRLTTLAQFRHSGAEEMTGAAGQQRVPKAFVANYPLPIPPLAEQAAIVRYLDHTDGRIVRYLRSRERLIELLKEYSQAVIYESVTRGLDPDVPLKPSGVAWLGDVPTHWEVRRLKQAVTLMMGQSPPGSECSDKPIGLPFLQGCAEFGERHPSPVQFCRVPQKVSPMGAILLSVRAPVGRLNIADQEYGIGRGLCALLPHKRVLQTAFARYHLEVLEHGLRLASTGSTYDAVSVGDVGNQPLLVPPLAEQAAIAAYLDKQTAAIDAAIARARREIELLSEYRTRLIADVVTGQVDVREVAELSHLGKVIEPNAMVEKVLALENS